jgi:hypothetical protein
LGLDIIAVGPRNCLAVDSFNKGLFFDFYDAFGAVMGLGALRMAKKVLKAPSKRVIIMIENFRFLTMR